VVGTGKLSQVIQQDAQIVKLLNGMRPLLYALVEGAIILGNLGTLILVNALIASLLIGTRI